MATRCPGCMKLKNNSPICEHCGYNENIPNYPHQLPIGTVLKDQYQVGKVLGQGGFGITYMGWDLNLDVPVAIKEYYPNVFVTRDCGRSLSVSSGDENRPQFHHNRERFLREARALAKLREIPGIVRIHNFFQENDTAYIVMEYVEGIDLHRYLKMSGSVFGAQRTLTLLQPIMAALTKVHEAGLVHRDLSPDNIMILPDGSAKLLDFGAVREVESLDAEQNLAHSTEAILKHGFAPMEQYQSRGSLGPWTDVYGLCATIYYCVTGRVPPDAPARLLDDRKLNWSSVPGLSQQQIAALEKGMAILPKERTANIAELYSQLYGPAQAAPQNAPQNIPNSAVQPQSATAYSGMQNDFRNAYRYTPASPQTPPIQQNNSYSNYPNHTVPLDQNGPSGYSYVPPVQPVPPVTPVPPVNPVPPVPSQSSVQPGGRKPKKGLLIVAAAAAVAAVVLIASLAGGGSKGGGKAGEPKEKLTEKAVSLESVLSDGADYTYDYRDGSLLELYYDNNDLERCRIFYNSKGDMEYKFVAEYNDFGDLLNHWVYDSKEDLIRQDAFTYDRSGNKLSHKLTDSDGKLLEQTEYSYDGDDLTGYVIKSGDGTVKQENAYRYENGKRVSALFVYEDGSTTEVSYNENENSEAQYDYDKNGELERWHEYEYNSDDKRTKTITYKPDGTVESYGVPVYNPNSKIVKETRYNADDTVSYVMTYFYIAKDVQIGYTYDYTSSKTEYEYVRDLNNVSVMDFGYSTASYGNGYSICYYNDFGQSSERTNYHEDGSLYYTSKYNYSDSGTYLGYLYTYYSDDGSWTETVYDADYNATAKTGYDAGGNIKDWTEYEYDSEGKCLKEMTYLADGTLSQEVEILYDNAGEVYRRNRTTYNIEENTYTVYVNDGKNNMLSHTTYDKNGKVTFGSTYEYEFDANGNKIKSYTYKLDGSLSYWTEYFYDENGKFVDSETHFT